ncbi:hypothetical protein [Streptomyces sp. YS-3]
MPKAYAYTRRGGPRTGVSGPGTEAFIERGRPSPDSGRIPAAIGEAA